MPDYELKRTGLPPLRFHGEQITKASSDTGHSSVQRWYDAWTYRTDSGVWVASVAYRSRWEGEHDRWVSFMADDPAGLVAQLADYDPVATLQGFPPGPHHAVRQERLRARLVADWAQCLQDLLDHEAFVQTL